MAGPVRLSDGGTVYAPIQIAWENSDGTQTNPKAVTYVKIFYIQKVVDDTLQLWFYDVGTKYTPPTA